MDDIGAAASLSCWACTVSAVSFVLCSDSTTVASSLPAAGWEGRE